MWKAVILKVSEVDSAGRFEVHYDIFCGEEKACENLVIIGDSKESVETGIKEKLESLKLADKQKNLLQIGDEISI